MILKREAWKRLQQLWDARKLVFIDETGVNTKMARRFGRSARGVRCVSAEPHGHWHSSTFVAALRYDRICAPFFFPGAMDSEAFSTYLIQELCSELKPGDIVIMDNLATHRIKAARKIIEAQGATLEYLPAYSPDFNPIEQAFSKLKAHLRQEAARTLDQLTGALATSLKKFSPEHCRNFFHHANYATT